MLKFPQAPPEKQTPLTSDDYLPSATELTAIDETINAPITNITANYVKARQLVEAAQKLRRYVDVMAEAIVKLQEEKQTIGNQLNSCNARCPPNPVGSWRADTGDIDRGD